MEVFHNPKGWNERYTFKKEVQNAVIDFYYTGKNTFSKVPGSSGASTYLTERVVNGTPYVGVGL